MTIYYVKNGGDDAKDGLSDANAWATIAKVNGFTFAAGDSVLLRCGDTWRERLLPPSGGTVGSPIVYGSYGAGALPILNGNTTLTGFAENVPGTGEDFTDASGAKPEAWWYFEEADGASRLDESGNGNTLGNTGTVTQSTTHKQGSFGAAVDATPSYLTLASPSANYPLKLSPTTGYTIGGWINFSSLPSANLAIYDHSAAGSGGAPGMFITVRTTNKLRITYKSDFSNIESDAAINTGWTHVVARWDGTTVTMFVGGVAQTATGALADATERATDPVHFNRWQNSQSGSFVLDEWFAFNTGLTDLQIADIYNYGLTGLGAGSHTTYTLTTDEPADVFVDNAILTRNTSAPTQPNTGEWGYSSGVLYLGDDPTGHTIDASYSSFVGQVLVESLSWVTVQDLATFGGTGTGIQQKCTNAVATNVTIQRCTVDYPPQNGISWGGSTAHAGSAMLITGNTVRNAGFHGIIGGTNVSASTVAHNTVTGSGRHPDPAFGYHGISLFGNSSSDRPSGITVEYNTVSGTLKAPAGSPEGAGVQCDDNSFQCVLRFNLSTANEGYGYFLGGAGSHQCYRNIALGNQRPGIELFAANNEVYHNVCVANTVGIQAFTTQSANVLKNNILSENTSSEMNFDVGTTTGLVSDYNCVYHSAGGSFMVWSGTAYNWADWKTNSSQDANSVNANPLFVNAAASDFRLQSTSPCIDKGVVIAGINDGTGSSTRYNNNAPDIGASEAVATNFYWVQPHRVKPLMGDATTN